MNETDTLLTYNTASV